MRDGYISDSSDIAEKIQFIRKNLLYPLKISYRIFQCCSIIFITLQMPQEGIEPSTSRSSAVHSPS